MAVLTKTGIEDLTKQGRKELCFSNQKELTGNIIKSRYINCRHLLSVCKNLFHLMSLSDARVAGEKGLHRIAEGMVLLETGHR